MKLVKHIPNSITSMNLLCGVVGVIFTLKGRIDIAFPLMLAAAVFDFCDGLAARLLGAYSDMGKELDSLSDMVSFGVLPTVMLYETMVMNSGHDSFACYIPVVLAIFSGLRLAKFNVDERQHDSFIGLATPAAAMICGSLTYYVMHSPFGLMAKLCATAWFIPALAVVLAALLVCGIPMFAMKFGKGKQDDTVTNFKRIAFVSIIVMIIVIVAVLRLNWSMIVLMAFIGYILMNLIFYAVPATRK